MAAANNQKELIKAQNGTYEVTKALATGTFGSIYKAKRESDGKYFVIKCESLKMKNSLLRQASMVLASLHYPSQHFVAIEERGTVPFRFLFIVMPLYGDNLSDLMANVCQTKKYSTSSALHLAEQTLSAIRDLHRNGFIHRDIKPSHFCIGREDEDLHHQVFLIDFGLCKRPRYRKGEAEAEEQMRKNAILYRGVVRYASLNAHASKELGYRDDMESWWFMVLEFFLGNLPWAMLSKQSEKDVVNLKTNLNETVMKPVWKIAPAALTTFFDFLRLIRAVPDIADFVEYDRIAEGLKSMFDTTKTNPMEPPDWDCLADYKGPAYQPQPMQQAPEVGMKEQDFAHGEGNIKEKAALRDSKEDDGGNKKKKKVKKSKQKKDKQETEDEEGSGGGENKSENKKKKKQKKKH